jgi:hypothetical protein
MQENYKIIANEQRIQQFIDWLPDLKPNETFYVCLFSRKKYCPELKHIKSDKSQLKRFTTTKERLIEKLKQLEIPLGLYKQDENPIPNHAIACYITANPRCNKKALQLMMKKGLDLMIANDNRFNLHQEAMSCVQKSKSYTFVLDFDIDIDKDLFKELDIENKVLQYVNTEAISWLETRGGFHLLIKPNLVNKEFSKTFYNNIVKNIPYIDKVSDHNLIPIPGTYQGGFETLLK